jgi:hypothetical protein
VERFLRIEKVWKGSLATGIFYKEINVKGDHFLEAKLSSVKYDEKLTSYTDERILNTIAVMMAVISWAMCLCYSRTELTLSS